MIDKIREAFERIVKASSPANPQDGEFYEGQANDVLQVRAALKEIEEVDVEAIKQELAEYLYGHNKEKWSLPVADQKVVDYLHQRGMLRAVPEGYVLVPEEPTEEMRVAAFKVRYENLKELIATPEGEEEPKGECPYKAMIKAARKYLAMEKNDG